MKKIEILGIEIKDYPLKELLKLATDGLLSPGVLTISWLSGNILTSVNNNQEQREWLNDIDLTICPDAKALKTRDGAFKHDNDGKSQDFIDIYFKYISKVNVDIALVADNEKRLTDLKKWIKDKGIKLNVIAEFTIDDIEKKDYLFNSLNMEMSRMVITCLPWTLQGELFSCAKRLSNSSAWMAVLPEMVQDKKSKKESYIQNIRRFFVHKKIKKYKRKK